MMCEDCGLPASIEVQNGWNPAANNGAGGGSYVMLCEACYDQTDEAARHRAESERAYKWAKNNQGIPTE